MVLHSPIREDHSFHDSPVLLDKEEYANKDRLIAFLKEKIKEKEEARILLREELHEAKKLETMGILAGGFVHDFANLLTLIMGNTELALKELPPDAAAREFVKKIGRTAEYAIALSRKALMTSSEDNACFQKINLSDLVEKMAMLLKEFILKETTLVFDLNPSLPPVEADPVRISQVITNLVRNAADAIGKHHGVISIGTGIVKREGVSVSHESGLNTHSWVCLEVNDTGCGIEKEELDRLFDPFFTTKTRGCGLGLAASLAIVKGHGGEIKVTSTSGRGSFFRMFLPARNDTSHD